MKKIIVLRGIPASGKSTWSLQFIKDNPGYFRVNRDSFRRMLIGDAYDFKIEKLVTQLQEYTIESILGKHKHLIIDNTNCKESYFSYICDIAKKIGDVKVSEKIFDVSFEECCRRNNLREGVEKVPMDIMIKMQENFDRMPKTERIIYFSKEIKTFPYDKNIPECIVSDLDGTLFLNERGRSPFDWKRVGEDSLNKHVAEILKPYYKLKSFVILMSGRDSICRQETIDCLKKFNVNYDFLYMRKQGDMRPDEIIKKELYEEHIKGKFNVMFWMDDRNKVVKMLREQNLTVLQVADGNF